MNKSGREDPGEKENANEDFFMGKGAVHYAIPLPLPAR